MVTTPQFKPEVLRSFKFLDAAGRAENAGDSVAYHAAMRQAAEASPEAVVIMASENAKANQLNPCMAMLDVAFERGDNKVKSNALGTYGKILADKGQRDTAKTVFEESLRLWPRNAAAKANLALCLHWLNRQPEALRLINDVIRSEPRMHHATFCRSLMRLVIGDMPAAWSDYEARFLTPDSGLKKRPALEWTGHNAEHVCIYFEQGAGDTIQMLRYAPLMKQRGLRVSIFSQRGLGRLIKTMGCFEHVLEPRDPNPVTDNPDALIPAMSLPRIFQTDLQTIPPAPYIPQPEKLPLATQTKGKIKVGIVWAGSVDHVHDNLRSLNIEQLAPILAVPGVDFYSLQVGHRSIDIFGLNDILGLDASLHDLSLQLKDYHDTAAAIAAMDLIITVDTSVAHLAGAIGKTCWVLLPFAPDWRWLLDRSDSPWYPSLRLFRQPEPMQWEPVIENVAKELEKECSTN